MQTFRSCDQVDETRTKWQLMTMMTLECQTPLAVFVVHSHGTENLNCAFTPISCWTTLLHNSDNERRRHAACKECTVMMSMWSRFFKPCARAISKMCCRCECELEMPVMQHDGQCSNKHRQRLPQPQPKSTMCMPPSVILARLQCNCSMAHLDSSKLTIPAELFQQPDECLRCGPRHVS